MRWTSPNTASETQPGAQQRDEGPQIHHTHSSASLPVSERDAQLRKLRRSGSKLKSALRSLTNRGSQSGKQRMAQSSTVTPETEAEDPFGAFRKRFTFPALRAPFGHSSTVIQRHPPRPRLSVRPTIASASKSLAGEDPSPDDDHSSQPTDDSQNNSNSSGNSSAPTHKTNHTGQTSVDSKLSKFSSSRDAFPVDKKLKPQTVIHSENKEFKSSSGVDCRLPLWRDSSQAFARPTILTVEKAAAAKIFFETHFNELLSRQSPRDVRKLQLEADLYHSRPSLTEDEKDSRRQVFYEQETIHLRETRVLKSARVATMKGLQNRLADSYETIKILGKGSFGVVRLVREKSQRLDVEQSKDRSKAVYAMKVIRKSAMLKTNQEGHLRAERDFLASSEDSNWVIPLIASFQDTANLYLVMDYMPGGDFLGLLIRENTLNEPVAKFFIAEMILCIEEAHSFRFIHRDIKPDNFLISASGHLKISDFGLAFDGHWSHDTSYFHTQRYSLVDKLGLDIAGDRADRQQDHQGNDKWKQNIKQAAKKHQRSPRSTEWDEATNQEPLLSWRNRCGNRTAARSVVGTSQYMAPEVIREGEYDARCDWWSLGIILYECLYGHTPFLSEEGGRQETKRNIVNHQQTFAFPTRPIVSRRCVDLMTQLIRDSQSRLCSKRYQLLDLYSANASTANGSSEVRGDGKRASTCCDWMGRYVYPHDAEDIKAHKWFRDIPWDRLHLITPPFVPQLAGEDDTRYFEEEEPISDWSESQPEGSSEDSDVMMLDNPTPTCPPGTALQPLTMSSRLRMCEQLCEFPRAFQGVLQQWVDSPFDTAKMKMIHREIDTMLASKEDQDAMKNFVRTFGRKEKKRPRDRLLRDRATRHISLEVRKQNAFLGYTWKRMRRRISHSNELAMLSFGGDGTVRAGLRYGMGLYQGAQ